MILEAIEKQDKALIEKILKKTPELIESLNSEGVPRSFLAARTGNLELVKYIVEYSRASMNVVDSQNQTILHYAAISGSVELSKYLIEKVGMSITDGDENLVTPFDIAREMGHTGLEDYYSSVCGCKLDDMYRNPIRTGMFPDPSIIRVGEDYYMVNSSFIFFPCIPISHSKDLINWSIIGYAITNPEWARLDDLDGGRGYWAPDISFYDGRFYITATYRMNDTGTVYRQQVIVSSEKAEGPYSEPSIIHEDGIDPSIFNDDDGRRYMLLNRGARILELNREASKQISKASLLYYGSQKRAPEGPHILKKDGYYYLFLAEGGTGLGHRITVARSKELHGNYESCPYNPIMRQKDSNAAIQRCGHGKPVQTQNGEWYMVYLCGRRIGEGYSVLGRETALDPIRWTEDGWPIVNELRGPSVLQKKPLLPEHKAVDEMSDYFEKKVLSHQWMFPRPPEKDGYELKEGQLWLKGSKEPLSSRNARNIMLRRQQHFSFEAESLMSLVPMSLGQMSGMTCYYDENTWLVFAVEQGVKGEKHLVIREHIGLEDRSDIEEVVLKEGSDTLYLRIRTQYLRRTFYYSYDGESYHEVASLENVYYLCDEGISMGKRFTGAMVGLFAYGGAHSLEVSFDFFKYATIGL